MAEHLGYAKKGGALRVWVERSGVLILGGSALRTGAGRAVAAGSEKYAASAGKSPGAILTRTFMKSASGCSFLVRIRQSSMG